MTEKWNEVRGHASYGESTKNVLLIINGGNGAISFMAHMTPERAEVLRDSLTVELKKVAPEIMSPEGRKTPNEV